MAGVAALALRALARRPPQARYLVACGGLVAMLALPVASVLGISGRAADSPGPTLGLGAAPAADSARGHVRADRSADAGRADRSPAATDSPAVRAGALNVRGTLASGAGHAPTTAGPASTPAPTAPISARLEGLLPLIVAAWLVGVALVGARAAGGWWLLGRRLAAPNAPRPPTPSCRRVCGGWRGASA